MSCVIDRVYHEHRGRYSGLGDAERELRVPEAPINISTASKAKVGSVNQGRRTRPDKSKPSCMSWSLSVVSAISCNLSRDTVAEARQRAMQARWVERTAL